MLYVPRFKQPFRTVCLKIQKLKLDVLHVARNYVSNTTCINESLSLIIHSVPVSSTNLPLLILPSNLVFRKILEIFLHRIKDARNFKNGLQKHKKCTKSKKGQGRFLGIPG